MSVCNEISSSYLRWLQEEITARMLAETCEITTPFLDRHNDYLQIYANKTDNEIRLTDGGSIIGGLQVSGVEINTPKRKEILDTTLNGLGVTLRGSALVATANEEDLGLKIQSLLQAMLSVDSMYMLAQRRVASVFREDVREFLSEHSIDFRERVELVGVSGFDHKIDFFVPRSDGSPDRLLDTISDPIHSKVGNHIFTLTDTRDAQTGEAEAFAFLNDRDDEVPPSVVGALESYEIRPAFWSERDAVVPELMG